MINSDFRKYIGVSYGAALIHYGKGHNDNPPGRGSGRYPWGGGKTQTKKKLRTKDEILKKPTPEDLMEIRDELTDNELRNALNRIKMDKELSKLIDNGNALEDGFNMIDNLMKKVATVNVWYYTSAASIGIIMKILSKLPKNDK